MVLDRVEPKPMMTTSSLDSRYRTHIPKWALLPMLACGCRAPEAPKEYEDLVAFLFEHAGDDDDAELVAGIDNLTDWLNGEQLDRAEAGMTIGPLPETAIDSLEGESLGVAGLAGVSLVTQSDYCADLLMEALTQYSFATIMPDVYTVYDREFDIGDDCIVDRSCLIAEGHVYSIADWGLLGDVEANRQIEFRWVETALGWVFLQRWWLTEPSTGSALDLVIANQYYIGINLPMDQGTRRVHASWLTMEMSTGDASDGAANQLIDNWNADAEELDDWIDENL